VRHALLHGIKRTRADVTEHDAERAHAECDLRSGAKGLSRLFAQRARR
jgi:hypothetical protein